MRRGSMVAGIILADTKAANTFEVSDIMYFFASNIAAHLTFSNSNEEVLDLVIVAHHLHFYSAVWQIRNPPADVKPHGLAFRGVTKADALYAPLIEDLFGCHVIQQFVVEL